MYKDPKYMAHGGRKVCKNCETDKSVSEFSRYAKTHDGFHTICKLCRRIKERNRGGPRHKIAPAKAVYVEKVISTTTKGYSDYGYEPKPQIRMLHISRFNKDSFT